MTYTKRVEREDDFETVVGDTIEALEAEGFGVLTDVDVQSTMEEKIGEDMEQYRILGACDPSTAFSGLQEESALGALLPCNVAVYEREDGTVVVDAVDPDALLGLADNDDLEDAVEGVEDRFDRVVESVRV